MTDRKTYIDETGDALELDEEFFQTATRGRPALPATEKKQAQRLMLDPDVIAKLRAKGNMSAAANAILREALGL